MKNSLLKPGLTSGKHAPTRAYVSAMANFKVTNANFEKVEKEKGKIMKL